MECNWMFVPKKEWNSSYIHVYWMNSGNIHVLWTTCKQHSCNVTWIHSLYWNFEYTKAITLHCAKVGGGKDQGRTTNTEVTHLRLNQLFSFCIVQSVWIIWCCPRASHVTLVWNRAHEYQATDHQYMQFLAAALLLYSQQTSMCMVAF